MSNLYGVQLPRNVLSKIMTGAQPRPGRIDASQLAQLARRAPAQAQAIADLAAQGMDADVAAAAVGEAMAAAGAGISGTKECCAGFDTLIAGGGQAVVDVAVQVPFHARSLWIASDTASNFTLLELKLGLGTNLVTSGAAPCQVFSELGQGIPWQIGVAQVGQAITMRFNNVTTAPSRIRGVWWGTALLPAGQ